MTQSWKLPALSLATTLAVAYVFCVIFDELFSPFGLIPVLAPASPWPISGGPLAFLTVFVLVLSSARSMESQRNSGAKNCTENASSILIPRMK